MPITHSTTHASGHIPDSPRSVASDDSFYSADEHLSAEGEWNRPSPELARLAESVGQTHDSRTQLAHYSASVTLPQSHEPAEIPRLQGQTIQNEAGMTNRPASLEDSLQEWMHSSGQSHWAGREAIGHHIRRYHHQPTENRELSLAHIDSGGSLPEVFHLLPPVAGIRMSNCDLQTIPETLMAQEDMERLSVSGNDLTELPSSIDRLRSLNVLIAEENRLNRLPDELGFLSQLQRLYLANNFLTTVPDSMSMLESLETLELNGNRLESLPEGMFERMHQLTMLDLSDNQLTEIPDSIWRLPPGCHVDLTGNPLSQHALQELASRGLQPLFVVPEHSAPQETLVQALQRQMPALDTRPLQHWNTLAESDPQTQGFQQWLDRLPETAEFRSDGARDVLMQRIFRLLDAMTQDPNLREICCQCADDAIATCEDRVILGLNDMELAHLNHRAKTENWDSAQLLHYGKGMMKMEMLNDIARETNAMHTALPYLTQLERLAGEFSEANDRTYRLPPMDIYYPVMIEARAERALRKIEQIVKSIDEDYDAGPLPGLSDPTPGPVELVAGIRLRTARAEQAIEHFFQLGHSDSDSDIDEMGYVGVDERDPVTDEAVEVNLAYQLALKDRLDLPVETQHMRYAACADLSQEDIDLAEEQINEQMEDTSRQQLYLSQWEPMQAHLQREHHEEWQQLNDDFSGQMEALFNDGPAPGEKEGEWKARLEQVSSGRESAIAAFYQRHTATLLGGNE